MIRPMRSFEETDVRAIYRACHPTWPRQPDRFYEAHPTLIALEQGDVVGFCSYSLGMAPEISAAEIMIGHGIDIRPGHEGKGYGRALCDARLVVARSVGATVFLGHAAPDNHAMIRLFERDGFKPYGATTDPGGGRVLLYMGPVR